MRAMSLRRYRTFAFLASVFALLTINSFNNSLVVQLGFDVSNHEESILSTRALLLDRLSNADDSSLASSELPLCSREQLRHGEWRSKMLQAPPYISKTMHLRCSNYDFERLGPYQSYEWVPHDNSCQFARWNATEFCDLLPFTTVSIIGDSLSWEQYSSLLQLLGARVHQKDQFTSKIDEMNFVLQACFNAPNRGTRIVWRNDARLSAPVVKDCIAHDFPTVLVLNRGAHYENDTALMQGIQSLLPVLSQWQATCDRLEFKCHLFWRTTVPGHPGCAPDWNMEATTTGIDFTRPVNDLGVMETLVSSREYYNERSWNYHWQDFQHQNQLVLQHLKDYSAIHGLRYQVLDAYDINMLRPDGHRSHQGDCLHNCYPGKQDLYNQLLLHFLKIQRSPADADRMVQQFLKYKERIRSQQAPTANQSIAR